MNGSALPSRQANSNVLNSYDKPRINETRNRRLRPNKDQNNWAQGGIALLVCIRQVSAQDRPFCYNLQLHVFTEIGGGGSTPKSHLTLVKDTQLMHAMCQETSKSVEWFKRGDART